MKKYVCVKIDAYLTTMSLLESLVEWLVDELCAETKIVANNKLL